jgi:hypothetical protein
MYVSLFEEKNTKLLRFAVVLTTLIPFQGPERLANAINENFVTPQESGKTRLFVYFNYFGSLVEFSTRVHDTKAFL